MKRLSKSRYTLFSQCPKALWLRTYKPDEAEKDEALQALRSTRYPLLKKNLGYTIRKNYPGSNVFVLRPSSELMNFNDRKLLIAFRMAKLISEQLDGGKGITDEDVKDFKETGFGYQENKQQNC